MAFAPFKAISLLFVAVSLSGCGMGICLNNFSCSGFSPKLSLSAVEIDDSEITVAWSAIPADGLRFSVYYSTSANLDSLENIKLNGTKAGEGVDIASFQITGIPVDRDYYFGVIVIDQYGTERAYEQRGPFCGGDGTLGNEFLICDAGSLQYSALHWNARYQFANDIDASDTTNWNGGKGFKPVGNLGVDNTFGTADDRLFVGIVDGQGYAISGLEIHRPTQDDVGLYGVSGNGMSLQNVTLQNVAVEGRDHVGGVLGMGLGTGVTIPMTNVQVEGSISGREAVGGLVGLVASDHFNIADSSADITVTASLNEAGGLVGSAAGWTDCNSCSFTANHSRGRVSSSGDYAGGLFGYIFRGILQESSSSAQVTGYDFVGGLVGLPLQVTTSRSYATGAVVGHDYVGALIGYLSDGTLTNSYAQGSAGGNQYVAALVGGESFNAAVTRSYGSGAVSAALNPAGIMGYWGIGVWGYVYWDSQTTGQTFGRGNSGVATTVNQYESKTTTQMQQQATYVTWDFSTVWMMPEGGGYPILRWQAN